MAGHSKWANIQHRKGRVDAQRGKMWTKLSKAIIVAAQMGGPDPDANFRLRKAISDAKALSMPKDNIQRAIKRGCGELDGGRFEEVLYEGYGPGGVAVMLEIATDNRNRTAPELRNIFSKYGGELGKTGCVAYLFERKGRVTVSAENADEETLMELAIEAGAEDVRREEGEFEILCEPDAFDNLITTLEKANIETIVSKIDQIPNNTVDLDAKEGRKVLKLVTLLDDHDDVQNVSANFNLSDEVMAELSEEN